ncbi:MAG: thermosome subunit beta [Nitrososphaeraceae archaeon]|jgi:thermosome|nr:thermosome subunit beta [Nitrososphaeraceae archaeon]MDW0137339.1 thermosome subunit beta [Nitrososphaeraceae archaeon]MDW0138287.1 thermosome subunit beta [Nitrososphaeraceae archaeon]MDW0141504.1 thermosome subunit beta [Nitrososphaeraceae archaeon]MDW0143456.1 thermosome subunit beta [Nitrososphaeraceae archaeon]
MSVQQGSAGGMPVLILKEGATQTKGRDAQKNNIAAAKLIAEVVKSSLGPRGMDKMLVDGLGDVTITNDGATILKEIDVQHPAAKMMVEISKATDNEVGDGTSSVVVLAGALIEKAEELIAKDVHPTIIVDGYRKSALKSIEIFNQIAQKIDGRNKSELVKVAKTSMQTKLVSKESDALSELVVNATLEVSEPNESGYSVDIDDVKVEKKAGGSLRDTKLIKGIVLDKEVVHGGMPKRVEKAKIALINSALEIEKTEFDAKININSPDQMKMFLEEENKMLKSMVDRIISSGANVAICQKGIDDVAQHYLAKSNILAVRRVKESDMTKLSRATGARTVNNLEDLSSKDLGLADLVEERKVETDKWVFIEGCKHPKAVTILIRGGSQRVVDEAERSIHDALMVTKDVMEKPLIVAGGGSPESFVAGKLREWSSTLSGREQLAADKFAESLEVIPLALAENAGMDPIDTLTELRSKQAKGSKWSGIDARSAKIVDMSKLDIVEPLSVKEQIIKSATEVASMILRIDDVIASSKSGGPPGGGGMPPGMGEM